MKILQVLGFSRSAVLVAALLCIFGLGGCAATLVPTAKIGAPAPFARLYLLDGSVATLEQFKGKDTVVVFWGTWCHNSRPVMERLNEIAELNSKNPQLVFVAVSLDRLSDEEQVKERIVHSGWRNFVHAFSGNESFDEAYQAFGDGTLPIVAVINRRGVLAALGNDTDIVEQFIAQANSVRK